MNLNYIVFYSTGTFNIEKGYHIGWIGESHRVSKFGPFETEDQAQKILDTFKIRNSMETELESLMKEWFTEDDLDNPDQKPCIEAFAYAVAEKAFVAATLTGRGPEMDDFLKFWKEYSGK